MFKQLKGDMDVLKENKELNERRKPFQAMDSESHKKMNCPKPETKKMLVMKNPESQYKAQGNFSNEDRTVWRTRHQGLETS